jgi:hypothetical protein
VLGRWAAAQSSAACSAQRASCQLKGKIKRNKREKEKKVQKNEKTKRKAEKIR